VNAPEFSTPTYRMSYRAPTVEWQAVPTATRYELFLSTTDLQPSTPTAIINAAAGELPKFDIPTGSPLDTWISADVVTYTPQYPGGVHFHRFLLRPGGEFDCIGNNVNLVGPAVSVCANDVIDSNPGILNATITRKPNTAAGDRMYEIKLELTGMNPGQKVKFKITEPTPIDLSPTTPLGLIDQIQTASRTGIATVTVMAKNPRGVFKATATDATPAAKVLGTVEVK
jgi:hypothetical protein